MQFDDIYETSRDYDLLCELAAGHSIVCFVGNDEERMIARTQIGQSTLKKDESIYSVGFPGRGYIYATGKDDFKDQCIKNNLSFIPPKKTVGLDSDDNDFLVNLLLNIALNEPIFEKKRKYIELKLKLQGEWKKTTLSEDEKLQELFDIDVELDGMEKAIGRWQWRYANNLNDWQDCDKPLSFNTNKKYRRKN